MTESALVESASPVLIAGGGIGGLVTALSLLQRGQAVRVFEQADEWKEVGAGVQLSSNATRVLCALGLREAMEKIATVPAGKEVRLYSTGQTWPLLELGGQGEARYGAPYWMVHRGDFHRVLLDALHRHAPQGVLQNASRAVGFEQDGDGVTLLVEGGRRVQGRVLVGADGVHSQVRRQRFGESLAKFTGFVAWRGVINMAALPQPMQRMVGVNWIGPHGHVVMYPLRRGELLNFVAAVEKNDWTVEGWMEQGTVEECLRDFARWHDEVKQVVSAITVPYKWALLSHPELPNWSDGRVTLLGDAAHPTLPFMSQGANMAIEDGCVLARAVQAYADPREALARYEAARKSRTARLVQAALDNVDRFHNEALADPARAAGFVSQQFAGQQVSSRYDWVYAYDPLQAPL